MLRPRQELYSKGCNILFRWVPGQASICGNTKADATAKAALDKDVALMNRPYTDFKQGINLCMSAGARCSSVVRTFTHGAIGRRINPSWGGPIELFLIPASAPQLV